MNDLTALLTTDAKRTWELVFDDDFPTAPGIYIQLTDKAAPDKPRRLDLNEFLAGPIIDEAHELAMAVLVAMLMRAIQQRQALLRAEAGWLPALLEQRRGRRGD
ncbi:hypothetical protein [Oryzicola mucosus]|uniref:Uncharacterized protein n=1 Tax=Oryzicola mucosus TaxID=2767425 RepID=A0A8J6PQF0_9HYPH|nr:hypothetical protein [Oryzicola mucosus]MBD0416130.1 hypothetical protein [Oryzicola mucosus]